jgi:hypothetical protein
MTLKPSFVTSESVLCRNCYHNLQSYHSSYGTGVKPKTDCAVHYIYLWLYSLLLDLGCFLNFLILYTVGGNPWTGDQPVARPLPIHRTTKTQNKLRQTSKF